MSYNIFNTSVEKNYICHFWHKYCFSELCIPTNSKESLFSGEIAINRINESDDVLCILKSLLIPHVQFFKILYCGKTIQDLPPASATTFLSCDQLSDKKWIIGERTHFGLPSKMLQFIMVGRVWWWLAFCLGEQHCLLTAQ